MVESSAQSHLCLLGTPGSGKGTQAEGLIEAFGFEHLATGDMLRREIQEQTPVGVKAAQIMSEGRLVPDQMMFEIIDPRLGQTLDGGRRILLDGFPRTIEQMEWLDAWFAARNAPYHVLFLDVPRERLIERLTGRLTCESCGAVFHERARPPAKPDTCDACGGRLSRRPDDTPEAISQRLKTYEEQTFPLLDGFERKAKLTRVAAGQTPDKVLAAVIATLGRLQPSGEG